MLSSACQVVVFLCVCMAQTAVVNALPTGAPEAACSTFKPNHRKHQAQPSTTFPYSVSMSKDMYTSPTDKITVSLKSTEGKAAFKGFLLVARNEDNKPFGSWQKSSFGHQLSDCAAMTHNDNNEKRSVSLIWQPPSNATKGKVSMTIAVVQNVSTFWINIPVKVGDTIEAAASSIHSSVTVTGSKMDNSKFRAVASPTTSQMGVTTSVTFKPIKAPSSTVIKPKFVHLKTS